GDPPALAGGQAGLGLRGRPRRPELPPGLGEHAGLHDGGGAAADAAAQWGHPGLLLHVRRARRLRGAHLAGALDPAWPRSLSTPGDHTATPVAGWHEDAGGARTRE